MDDEAAEWWYREQGINRDEMDEMFAEHLEEIQTILLIVAIIMLLACQMTPMTHIVVCPQDRR
jgi:hypothetical protein